MTFNDSYTVSGNLLTLTGDVSGLVAIADLKVGGSIRLDSSAINGAIDVNGQTLTAHHVTYNGTINGNGTMIVGDLFGGGVTIAAGGNFSGSVQDGPSGGNISLAAGCSLPNANVSIQLLRQIDNNANATLGELTITPSVAGYAAAGHFGTLHTKSFSLDGGPLLVFIEGGGASQFDVTGTVSLSGPLGGVYVDSTPAPGQSFTIINNDGTDPVIGTFAGLPEGASVDAGAAHLHISYVGGDGNDVVLRSAVGTNTAISQNLSTTQFGAPIMITATTVAATGTPTGSVVFKADGLTVGSALLQNGTASVTVTTLNSGPHTLVASFLGTGAYASSDSAGLSHVVVRGATKCTITGDHSSTAYGQAAGFSVAVTAQAPAAGQPSGSAGIFADGVILGTVPLVSGTAVFQTSAFHAGVKTITATYNSDANFEGSTAPAIQQNVAKVQTGIDARPGSGVLIGQSPFITVFVNVIPGSALAPSGAVSISEGGAPLGTQSLARGAAILSLDPMAVGDHTLVVTYGGDTDFEESSTTIVQTVGAPSLSIHGAHVIEGNRGVTNVSLVVSLSAPVAAKVRVSFSTMPGTATAGEDYESASGVIEFGPGELMHAIELHLFGDPTPEADEMFSVQLSAPFNATIDTPSALIVIANDDQVPPRRRPSGH
jgi:hypothetical protein